MVNTQRTPGREHFPNYPRGFIVLRCLQLALAVITIGLTGYALSYLIFAGACVMLFTALITMIVTIWLISAHSCAPRAYNYWAVLVLDLFLLLWWLLSFGIMAAQLAIGFYYVGVYQDQFDVATDFDVTYASILSAAVGLGVIEFIMFLVGFIIHAVVVARHRRAGLHSKPTSHSKAVGGASAVGAGAVSVQMMPQGKTTYEAVPQHGFPYGGAPDTAYNPNQMYNPPPANYAPAGYPMYYAPQQPGQQQVYSVPGTTPSPALEKPAAGTPVSQQQPYQPPSTGQYHVGNQQY